MASVKKSTAPQGVVQQDAPQGAAGTGTAAGAGAAVQADQGAQAGQGVQGAATTAASVPAAPRAAQVPAEAGSVDELMQDAGKGVSSLSRDNIIPMIYVLQPLSPQVQERDKDRFIEGAKAGMLWLRNSPVPLVSGDDGMAFQPVHFRREVVEWIPRDLGGGFVARYPFKTPDESLEELARRMNWRMEPSENKRRPPTYHNGDNELREMRYHSGYVHGGFLGLSDHAGLVLPFVLPFGGTGHQVSRGWMTSINQHTFAEVAAALGQPNKPEYGQRIAPAASRLYKLTTKWRKNASGEWAQIYVEDSLGWVTGYPRDLAAYRRGIALHDAIERGDKEFERPEQAGGEDGGETAEDRTAAVERAGV